MLKTCLISLVALMFCINGFSITKDTLIVSKPVYHSEFEKKYLGEFFASKKLNSLELSLSLDSTMSENKRDQILSTLNNYLSSIEDKVSKEKDDAKKIKLIFSATNKEFFKKYSLDISFDKLFSTGEFNCVTGSLMYAHILQHFNIPYLIKELPTHVFLVAFPTTFSIPVESTDQGMRYYIPDEKTKQNYAQFLVDSKIATAEELAASGVEGLFNKYYYSHKDISLQQLLGLQYYNAGISLSNNKNFNASLHQFEKAYMLYPSEKMKYMIQMSLLSVIFENRNEDVNNLDNYMKLVSYFPDSKYGENFMYEFNKITRKYLIEQNKPDYYDQIYQRVKMGISDQVLMNKVSLMYYTNKARTLGMQGQYDQGLSVIDKAYEINHNDLEVNNMVANFVLDKLRDPTDFEKSKKMIADYTSKYPMLAENPNILRLSAMYNLSLAIKSFATENKAKGSAYLAEFEKLKAQKEIKVDANLLGRAYGEASSSYARAKDMKTAKAILLKGLTYSPDNEELNRKLKYMTN